MAGVEPEQAVGRCWAHMLTPDDLVLNKRINGSELDRIDDLLTGTSDAKADPMIALLLLERRGGERLWALARLGRVSVEGRPLPLIYIVLTRVTVPRLEVLEGRRPSADASADVSELLQSVRGRLAKVEKAAAEREARVANALRHTESGDGPANAGTPSAYMLEAKRRVEEEVGHFLLGRAAEERSTSPVSPKHAPDREEFEAAGGFEAALAALSSSDAAAMSKDISRYEGSAWFVAKLSKGASLKHEKPRQDSPLVYVSPQFEKLTGYNSTWALGRDCRFLQPRDEQRNLAFNQSEKLRIRNFLQRDRGKMAALLMNERRDGSMFWNQVVLERLSLSGVDYMMASMTNIEMHQDMLSLMNTWDTRTFAYIEKMRNILRTVEERLSTLPSRSQASESLVAECFAEWSTQVASDLEEIREGDHYVPRVGCQAVEEFQGKWMSLMDSIDENFVKIHGIKEGIRTQTRANRPGGIVCCVSDPFAPECPLVFISKEFEIMTGYNSDFALGRNCRFLQPNQNNINKLFNGEETSMLRRFCTELDDRKIGSSILSLLLNERKDGRRFWNLLHMMHVEVAGRRYIVGVQTVLDLPVPAFLIDPVATNANLNIDNELPADIYSDLLIVLAKLRGRLSMLGQSSEINMEDITAEMKSAILDWMKTMKCEYEGDHYVPKTGMTEVRQFEQDSRWDRILKEAAPDMRNIWKTTEDTFAHPKAEMQGSVGCAVSDPSGSDCALVYISNGFEKLTGYKREWALGRNCRFLQPNHKTFNDNYNAGERALMREFCTLPRKDGPLVNLLLNESRDGYPFWNCLVMKYFKIDGCDYIFGVQTNLYKYIEVLAELLGGGEQALLELGRLRTILRRRSAILGTITSLQQLIDDSMAEWLPEVPGYFKIPQTQIKLTKGLYVPTVALEFDTETPVNDMLVNALEEGVRHFHVNFSSRVAHHTAIMQGRLFSLRIVESLALAKQKYLHYLRDAITFTMRSKPMQVEVCSEFMNYLNLNSFSVACWLLDINGASSNEIKSGWTTLMEAQHGEKVKSVGLYGGGAAELAAVRALNLKPAVQAVDFYPGAQPNRHMVDHLNNSLKEGVSVMACQTYGPKHALLKNDVVQCVAKECKLEPSMILTKWAEGLGYCAVVPFLRAGNKAKRSSGGVCGTDEGIHRDFARELTSARAANDIADVLKQCFNLPIRDMARPLDVGQHLDRPGALKPMGKMAAVSHAVTAFNRGRRSSLPVAVEESTLKHTTTEGGGGGGGARRMSLPDNLAVRRRASEPAVRPVLDAPGGLVPHPPSPAPSLAVPKLTSNGQELNAGEQRRNEAKSPPEDTQGGIAERSGLCPVPPSSPPQRPDSRRSSTSRASAAAGASGSVAAERRRPSGVALPQTGPHLVAPQKRPVTPTSQASGAAAPVRASLILPVAPRGSAATVQAPEGPRSYAFDVMQQQQQQQQQSHRQLQVPQQQHPQQPQLQNTRNSSQLHHTQLASTIASTGAPVRVDRLPSRERRGSQQHHHHHQQQQPPQVHAPTVPPPAQRRPRRASASPERSNKASEDAIASPDRSGGFRARSEEGERREQGKNKRSSLSSAGKGAHEANAAGQLHHDKAQLRGLQSAPAPAAPAAPNPGALTLDEREAELARREQELLQRELHLLERERGLQRH
eukprot:TRINITY_DN6924_c4_g1_i1.p1 TRINITY_DN6924_c4_g1~~TRINITY_DN6924_c4_g1_i1.p1  ORF type:complete len:1706 (+),score=369.34 TRINITY_DN6924_c4_g1_i1:174-5120(+)